MFEQASPAGFFSLPQLSLRALNTRILPKQLDDIWIRWEERELAFQHSLFCVFKLCILILVRFQLDCFFALWTSAAFKTVGEQVFLLAVSVRLEEKVEDWRECSETNT